MTTALSFRAAAVAVAVSAILALGACSGPAEEGHASAGEQAEHAIEHSSAGLPEGRIAAGEQLASTKGEATGQSCVDCHGPEGNAPIDPSYPKLAGQYSDYLAQALQAYRSGAREHALMSAQAQGLSDQQIADLAAYFGSREGELVDLANVD